MKTLGTMFTIILATIAVLFCMWLNSYEKNHNLLDAADMYYSVEIKGENEYVYLAKQFANELTDSLFD